MLKAALLCSVVCTAFVVGSPSSTAPQDKPAQVSKPANSLREVLRPLVGKKCGFRSKGDLFNLIFNSKDIGEKDTTLDFVGIDFVRVSDKTGTFYFPLSSIYVWTD